MFAILCREELKEYDFGPGHPFRSDRYSLQFLEENLPKDANYQVLEAEEVGDKDLSLICQKDYIDFTRDYFQARNLGQEFNGRFFQYHSSDNFPPFRPGKLEKAARIIIGQAKLACDLIQNPPPKFGGGRKVISLGGGMHHAKPNYGEGFCLYNDVAFAAKYLLKEYKLERILILDTDAHCGNGTMEYFYREPRVLFIDLHQDPSTLYPGTGFADQIGHGRGRGYTINIPLPPYAGTDSYKLVFEEIIEPVLKEFRPQIIIRNGGSDPHFADELAQLGLTVGGLRMMGEKVKNLAETCQGREIDMIGSGYNKKVLPHAWLALISGVTGLKIKIKEPIAVPSQFQEDAVLPETKKVIEEIKSHLRSYWECLR